MEWLLNVLGTISVSADMCGANKGGNKGLPISFRNPFYTVIVDCPR
jgi:hypothetical protein